MAFAGGRLAGPGGPRRGKQQPDLLRFALLALFAIAALLGLYPFLSGDRRSALKTEAEHALQRLKQNPLLKPQLSAEDVRAVVREELRVALAELGGEGGTKARRRKKKPAATSIHVVVTADSNDYMHWQCLALYHSYLKAAAVPGSSFSAFTRILHTGEADDLMDIFPTVVVPKGPKPDEGAPPIQRPPALIAWLEAAPPRERYVLMAEPDHIFVKPVPLGDAALGRPVAYYFSYVNFADHLEAFQPHLTAAGCALEDARRTGNSPSLMHVDDLRAVAPGWRDISIALHDDPAVRKAVGWVGEMYGFALAACAAGLDVQLQEKELMLHPPFDRELGQASIIHYTYPNELFANGSVANPSTDPKDLRVWAFDKRYVKRDYPGGRITRPPPGAPSAVVYLVDAINEALAEAGWDWSMPNDK